jgi:amidohydrolase
MLEKEVLLCMKEKKMTIDLFQAAKENEALSIDIRRHLHRYPELSSREFETLKYIRSQLEDFKISFVEVENGGIIASIGDESRGKTVLLRADIDALPIQENSCNLLRERDIISEIDGVQHACGHDAHTAMLLTAGKILKENEAFVPGRVLLMFERGEEGGGNIVHLVQYIKENKIHLDGAHAIHVRPGVPAGKIVAISGPIMAAGCGFDVTIIGRGGHGSRPDLANSPLDCFTSFYQALKDIKLNRISPFDLLTFSVGKLCFGQKGNIIADELTFQGSARVVDEKLISLFFEEFDLRLENITRAHRCTYRLGPRLVGPPVFNHEFAVCNSQKAIRKYLGEEFLIDKFTPMMGSESFSVMGKFCPSIMIHLGIDNPDLGSGADIHTDLFDIDEKVLPLGVVASAGFALEFLNHTEAFAD